MVLTTLVLLLSAFVPSLSLRASKQGPTVEIPQADIEEDTQAAEARGAGLATQQEGSRIAATQASAADSSDRDPGVVPEPEEERAGTQQRDQADQEEGMLYGIDVVKAFRDYQSSGRQSPAAERPGPGRRRGTAVCIVGQEARLERESKRRNLLQPLREAGYDPRVFLVLERGNVPVYSNAYRLARTFPDFGQFQESSSNVVHEDYTQDPLLLSNWSRLGVNYKYKEKELKRLMSNFRNQFRNWDECMKLVQRSELARGAEYDVVIKLRENSLVLSPLNMTDLMADRRVTTKRCGRWLRGVNDKAAVLPREHAEAYLSNPLAFVSAVRDGTEPLSSVAKFCVNTEQMLLVALWGAPKSYVSVNELPVVDGRPLRNGSFCRVPHHKDCVPNISSVPVCKQMT